MVNFSGRCYAKRQSAYATGILGSFYCVHPQMYKRVFNVFFNLVMITLYFTSVSPFVLLSLVLDHSLSLQHQF